jgi:hypothetical protein
MAPRFAIQGNEKDPQALALRQEIRLPPFYDPAPGVDVRRIATTKRKNTDHKTGKHMTREVHGCLLGE